MARYSLLRRLLLVLFCLGTMEPVGQAAAPSARPNIVLIVADDLGYGDLGVHGGQDIPTPRIDALAYAGVRCTAGYVSGPYCSPTRAGLLTGRYQQRFGHEFNPGPAERTEIFGLSVDEKTLPQRLKQGRYATGMVGKWHLGFAAKYHPLERGFDEFFGFLAGAHPYFPTQTNDPIQRGHTPIDEPAYLTDAFSREAVAYIDRNKQHPFFLYLAFNAVHNPQQAKPKHLDRFKAIEDQRRRTYAGMLTSMDEAVGAVLDKLKNEQLDQNTLVIFISDNGGPPVNGSTNTPLNGRKATTWEGGIRVPFFLTWPKQLPAGKTYDQPVIQLDLLPTILAATGTAIEGTAELDGVNLLPYLKNEKKEAPHESLYWRFGDQMALRQGDWKLVKAREEGAAPATPQLYNMSDDISEKHDLAAQNPDIVARLQADWDKWNATLVEPKWIPGPMQPDRERNPNRNRKKER